jgi:triphosphoribosyl-dephospho-CoA synthase
MPGGRVGARILGAVEATRAAVGTNTNLGIVLLCAPIAAAAASEAADLRTPLAHILEDLDTSDADLAFRAIALAAPAGLGRSARHDVYEPATVSLLQAMSEAAARDSIARQYATNFADVFERGLPVLETFSRPQDDPKWATLATYLSFLAAFPDSHIERKFGAAAAAEVCREAAAFQATMRAAERPGELLSDLLAWDTRLKARGLNPGTSADLTVATLFVHRLQTGILPSRRNSG